MTELMNYVTTGSLPLTLQANDHGTSQPVKGSTTRPPSSGSSDVGTQDYRQPSGDRRPASHSDGPGSNSGSLTKGLPDAQELHVPGNLKIDRRKKRRKKRRDHLDNVDIEKTVASLRSLRAAARRIEFNEALHRRDRKGRFVNKPDAPGPDLATPRKPAAKKAAVKKPTVKKPAAKKPAAKKPSTKAATAAKKPAAKKPAAKKAVRAPKKVTPKKPVILDIDDDDDDVLDVEDIRTDIVRGRGLPNNARMDFVSYAPTKETMAGLLDTEGRPVTSHSGFNIGSVKPDKRTVREVKDQWEELFIEPDDVDGYSYDELVDLTHGALESVMPNLRHIWWDRNGFERASESDKRTYKWLVASSVQAFIDQAETHPNLVGNLSEVHMRFGGVKRESNAGWYMSWGNDGGTMLLNFREKKDAIDSWITFHNLRDDWDPADMRAAEWNVGGLALRDINTRIDDLTREELIGIAAYQTVIHELGHTAHHAVTANLTRDGDGRAPMFFLYSGDNHGEFKHTPVFGLRDDSGLAGSLFRGLKERNNQDNAVGGLGGDPVAPSPHLTTYSEYNAAEMVAEYWAAYNIRKSQGSDIEPALEEILKMPAPLYDLMEKYSQVMEGKLAWGKFSTWYKERMDRYSGTEGQSTLTTDMLIRKERDEDTLWMWKMGVQSHTTPDLLRGYLGAYLSWWLRQRETLMVERDGVVKARDGDGDGFVHDGTPRMRPARPSEMKKPPRPRKPGSTKKKFKAGQIVGGKKLSAEEAAALERYRRKMKEDPTVARAAEKLNETLREMKVDLTPAQRRSLLDWLFSEDVTPKRSRRDSGPEMRWDRAIGEKSVKGVGMGGSKKKDPTEAGGFRQADVRRGLRAMGVKVPSATGRAPRRNRHEARKEELAERLRRQGHDVDRLNSDYFDTWLEEHLSLKEEFAKQKHLIELLKVLKGGGLSKAFNQALLSKAALAKASASRAGLRTLRAGIRRAKFDESKHRRGPGGRFANKPGSDKKTSVKLSHRRSTDSLLRQRSAAAQRGDAKSVRQIDARVARLHGGRVSAPPKPAKKATSRPKARTKATASPDSPSKAPRRPAKATGRSVKPGTRDRDPDAVTGRKTPSAGQRESTTDGSGASPSVAQRRQGVRESLKPPALADVLKDKKNYELKGFAGNSSEAYKVTDKRTGQVLFMKYGAGNDVDYVEPEELSDGTLVMVDFDYDIENEVVVPEVASSLGLNNLVIPRGSFAGDGAVATEWADSVVPEGWQQVDDALDVTLELRADGGGVDPASIVAHGERHFGTPEGRRELMELHVLDFLTNQTDRHASNWLEYEDGNGTRHIVPIDHGAAFDDFNVMYADDDLDPLKAKYEQWANFGKSQYVSLMLAGAYGGDAQAIEADLNELIPQLTLDGIGDAIRQRLEELGSDEPDYADVVDDYLAARSSQLNAKKMAKHIAGGY